MIGDTDILPTPPDDMARRQAQCTPNDCGIRRRSDRRSRTEVGRDDRSAWAAGWWAVKRPSGHVMCFHPTDKNEKVLVNNTAGDPHVVPRIRSYFRKAGLKL